MKVVFLLLKCRLSSGVAKTANAAAAKAEQPEKKEVEKKEEAAPVVSKDTVAMMELVPATTTDASTGIQPAVASGELWKPVISELQALGEEHTQGGYVLDLYFCDRFLRRTISFVYSVCMADYSYDGQLLPET